MSSSLIPSHSFFGLWWTIHFYQLWVVREPRASYSLQEAIFLARLPWTYSSLFQSSAIGWSPGGCFLHLLTFRGCLFRCRVCVLVFGLSFVAGLWGSKLSQAFLWVQRSKSLSTWDRLASSFQLSLSTKTCSHNQRYRLGASPMFFEGLVVPGSIILYFLSTADFLNFVSQAKSAAHGWSHQVGYFKCWVQCWGIQGLRRFSSI